MIYSENPRDWKDLQNMAGTILLECGLSVEIEKNIVSARGKVEVDVYAVEKLNSRENIIILECKYWENPIPQTIIHSFRTVMADIGANVGYIISKNGFQSGSYKAVEYSNIRLVTWKEFQDLFEDQWCEVYFSNYIERNWGGLISYSEPFIPEWIPKEDKEGLQEYLKIRSKYEEIGWLLLYLKTPLQIFYKRSHVKLPLADQYDFKNIPKELGIINGYQELLAALKTYCDPALEEYHMLKEALQKRNA